MDSLWQMLVALAAVLAPLLLAWWMLARGARRQDRHDRQQAGLPGRRRAKTSDTMGS